MSEIQPNKCYKCGGEKNNDGLNCDSCKKKQYPIRREEKIKNMTRAELIEGMKKLAQKIRETGRYLTGKEIQPDYRQEAMDIFK